MDRGEVRSQTAREIEDEPRLWVIFGDREGRAQYEQILPSDSSSPRHVALPLPAVSSQTSAPLADPATQWIILKAFAYQVKSMTNPQRNNDGSAHRSRDSAVEPSAPGDSAETHLAVAAHHADLTRKFYTLAGFPWPLRPLARAAYSLLMTAARLLTIPQSRFNRHILDAVRLLAAQAGGEARSGPAGTSLALGRLSRISLESFLASDTGLELPMSEAPRVSILLVLHNQAALTLECIRSIAGRHRGSYELVIVDNASTDETSQLLARIHGATIIRNRENVHFVRAANQAARKARGEYLLFLNNDAQVLDDGIARAVATLESDDTVGAVGARIILADGSLQEAGSIIWRDGSCSGYGRGSSPDDPWFMFRRPADFCSAAFLLTPSKLFLDNGCFDEDYAPAYYEETDYCVRLWKQGKRVIYDPGIVVLHHEGASATSADDPARLQVSTLR